MSLIDRYVAEVGRHLPEKDRSDIETEIQTMIEDTLDFIGAAGITGICVWSMIDSIRKSRQLKQKS